MSTKPLHRSAGRGGAPGPAAILLGDSMDMARALRLAGASVTVVGSRHAPARYGRHRCSWLEDPRSGDGALVDVLARATRDHDAALFYETDADLVRVSRLRDDLPSAVKVLLPSADLVESLVDKGRFCRLAVELGLPVPRSEILSTSCRPADLPREYPLLVKPLVRDDRWQRDEKALVVADAGDLQELLRVLGDGHRAVVVQTYVPGPETRVESYHSYVDATGAVVAEFTGRKVRTLPVHNGFSTAVTTTDAADVRALGRRVVRALGLVGVAKLDLKRDPLGRLWLLEVNPRFSLWHHLGAAAGVNLPQLVMADLLHEPRPPVAVARPDVTWCSVPKDLVSAWRHGVRPPSWLRFAAASGARSGLELGDPLPFLLGRLWPRVRQHARPPVVLGRDTTLAGTARGT